MPSVWTKVGDKLGKFLLVRRDGTVPQWPHFALGARDPAAPYALRAYAARARVLGWDDEYIASILELANDYDAYRAKEGVSNPPASQHRTDDPNVIEAMKGEDAVIHVRCDRGNTGFLA
jgi:hypothetical protein